MYDMGGFGDDMNKIREYEKIYERYANDVYRVSLFLLQDENKAKEITQQAFANVYKKLQEIDEKSICGQLLIEVKRLAKNHETKEEQQ